MILEVAVLDVKPGLAPEFETTFKAASAIVASMPGYISHQLQRCRNGKSLHSAGVLEHFG